MIEKESVSSTYAELSLTECEKKLVLLNTGERKIFEELVNGYNAASISKRKGLALHTIKSYIKYIYKKLGVHSQVELILKFEKAKER